MDENKYSRKNGKCPVAKRQSSSISQSPRNKTEERYVKVGKPRKKVIVNSTETE